MVEFKAVISDTKSGKAYQIEVKGHHANSLVGKKIGEEIDGIFVGLPGFKLKITGGSDIGGFPMRNDIIGAKRKKILITKSIGFKPKDRGVRKRKYVRGNMISQDISQVNFKISSFGMKNVDDLLKIKKGAK